MNAGQTVLATVLLGAAVVAGCGGRSDLSLTAGLGPVDACAGVTCTAPPSACYARSGTCNDGACTYAFADGIACDDGDPCTTNDACNQGSCQGTSELCPSAGSALKVSVGHSHACALTVGGEVWCWGYNHYGQLGNGTFVDSRIPVRVAGLPPSQLISTGFDHTCAVTRKWEVMCWGSNASGQLGNDTNLDSAVPVTARGLPQTGALSVSAGTAHSCALTEDQRVYCWGRNCCGEIGNDFASETLAAYPVQGLDFSASSVSAGQQFTCVSTTVGSAECFGQGGSGQPGQGRKADSKTPVQVVGLASATAVSAGGGAHACALTINHGVKCWGENIYGQLGPGVQREGSTTPVDISGLGSGASAISAGTNQVCAILLAGGSAVCWGDGDHGQLGNGSTTSSAVPVAVSGLGKGVISISAGALHACAVTAQGGVKCWGFNPYGELGDGTTKDSAVPVAVRGF